MNQERRKMSGTLSPTCDSISPSLEVERVVDWMDGWVEAPFAAPSDFDAAAPFERKLRRHGGALPTEAR